MIRLNELDKFQIDVLREVGNIGTGNAVTALAYMIQSRIDMKVPKIKILDFCDIGEIMGAEELVSGILLKVSGDLDASIMFLLDIKSAAALVNILMKRPSDSICQFEDIELSALMEAGNILSASYVSALSTLTNMNLKVSVPDIAIDMAGAILSVPAIEFGKVGDSVLYIETEFIEGNTKVAGNFFLIPDNDSYEKLLKVLGVF